MNPAPSATHRRFVSLLSVVALLFAFTVPASSAAALGASAQRIGVDSSTSNQLAGTVTVCLALDLLGFDIVTEANIDAALAALGPADAVLVTADVRSEILGGACNPPDTTDGGTDGSTDGGTDGSTDGGTDGSTDGGTDGSTDGGTDGSTDGGTDGSTDGGTDGSTNGGTDVNADVCAAINIGPDGIVVQAELDAAIASTLLSDPALSARIAANAAVILGGACNTSTTGATTGSTAGATGTTTGSTTDTTGTTTGSTAGTSGTTTGSTAGTTGSTAGTTGSTAGTAGTTGSTVAQVTGLPSTGSGSTMNNLVWPIIAAGSVMLMLGGHFALSTIKRRAN